MLFEKYRNRTQVVKRIWSKKYKIKFSATFIVNPKSSHMIADIIKQKILSKSFNWRKKKFQKGGLE